MLRKRRFDLAQLDAEAPDLDLIVRAAEELQLPVGEVAHKVAGSVIALPFERDELLRRQLLQVEVAACDPAAADVKLARHACGDELPRRVAHAQAHVRERPADHAALAAGSTLDLVARADDGRLRRPVEHADARAAEDLRYLVEQRRRHGLAADEDHLHPTQARVGEPVL